MFAIALIVVIGRLLDHIYENTFEPNIRSRRNIAGDQKRVGMIKTTACEHLKDESTCTCQTRSRVLYCDPLKCALCRKILPDQTCARCQR